MLRNPTGLPEAPCLKKQPAQRLAFIELTKRQSLRGLKERRGGNEGQEIGTETALTKQNPDTVKKK